MVAFINKSTIVIIFLLTGTSAAAEVPVSFHTQDKIANTKIIDSSHAASNAGMKWKILPGEDILQIARLMFPKNSVVRDKFIRAIIYTNPDHFPNGIFKQLPVGTIIYIPDLRTIDTYSIQSVKSPKPSAIDKLAKHKSQILPEAAILDLNRNNFKLQLITKLQQIAENQARELSILIKRIESLELQFTEIEPKYQLIIQERHKQPVDISSVTPEIDLQALENLAIPNETIETPVKNNLISHTALLILGILLTVLIVVMMLWNYRKIKKRFMKSTHSSHELSLPPEATDSHQYDVLASNRNDNKVNQSENLTKIYSQMVSDAGLIVRQGNPEAAVQFLQKQLSINRFEVQGWLLLFELLYTLGSKTDFKENALHFKELGEFPDIWIQIQNLGYQLDPDEPLYFNEQHPKEKFFSDSSDFY